MRAAANIRKLTRANTQPILLCEHNKFRKQSTSTGPKPFEFIPGLSTLPLIGSMHHFLPVIGSLNASDFSGMVKTLQERYGNIVKMKTNRSNMLILFEPDHYDQVYRSEDPTPLRPGFDTLVYYREKLRKSNYNGIYGLTTAQGADWRKFRTKVNPAMLKPKLVKFYTPGLNEIAKEFVQRLDKLLKDGSLNDKLTLEISKWSLESVGLVGLGTRLHCLKDDLPEDHPASKLMESLKAITDLTIKLEFLPSPWRYISTPAFKKVIKAYDTQWEVSAMYIEMTRKEIAARAHDVADEDKSIIEKLLAIDETVAIMMANEMLFGGIDTVTHTTTALLYMLAVNPEKQDKLREEIQSGDENKKYLKACLKETMRLYPAVTANLRRTSKEHVVGGYVIPEGIDVIAPNEYLSKTDEHYPRAKEFIPERWTAEKTDPLYYGNTHPMVNLPFGFGVRKCIGMRIAELEMQLVASRLLESYRVKWEGPPIKVGQLILNSFLKPFYFKFEKL